MKAVVCKSYGSTEEVVEIRDMPKPEPLPNDILIETHAASVNPIDFKLQRGDLKAVMRLQFPFMMGYDVSGVVVATGDQVKNFKIGDAVFSRVDASRMGTFAEFVAVDEKFAAGKPANITHEEAASFPLVALTSWQSMFDRAKLQSGQKVLIHAGSGGIGSVAIQLAKERGIFVATTTSTANVEMVKDLGADQVVDYRQEQFDEVLKDFDMVYETLGGENQYRSFKVLKPGGILVTISSAPTADWARKMGLPFYMRWLFGFLNRKNTSLAKQYKVEYDMVLMNPNGEQLQQVADLITAGKVKPLIDQVFPFDEAKQALLRSQSGRAKGKIIIRMKDNASK